MTNKKVFFQKYAKWVLLMGGMGVFFMVGEAEAATIFTNAIDTLYTTFLKARTVVYILSGFGLCGFATAAIFGKLSFRWLASIAIALFTLAAAEKIVLYITDAGSSTKRMTSTFAKDVIGDEFRIRVDGIPYEFETIRMSGQMRDAEFTTRLKSNK